MKVFDELATGIESTWARVGYDEEAFPKIAAEALTVARLGEGVDLATLSEWFLTAERTSPQTDWNFGEPEIVVDHRRLFYTQVLVWMHGTTNVHQHAFSGAFQVLAGASLHTRYRFERQERVNARLLIGDVRPVEVELLSRGDVREIVSRDSLIHALFHLETPSVTVVLRTNGDPGQTQYSYYPPCFALDAIAKDRQLDRRAELLRVTAKVDPERFDALLPRVLEPLDFERVLKLVMALLDVLDEDRLANCIDRLRLTHGRRADLLAAACAEQKRQEDINSRRGEITNPEHRFLMALLLNVRGRGRILELIAQRFPGDPIRTLVRWAGELVTLQRDGTARLVSIEIDAGPPVELPLDRVLVAVFAGLLEGATPEQLPARLAKTFGAELVAPAAEEIVMLGQCFPVEPFFAPLFSDR